MTTCVSKQVATGLLEARKDTQKKKRLNPASPYPHSSSLSLYMYGYRSCVHLTDRHQVWGNRTNSAPASPTSEAKNSHENSTSSGGKNFFFFFHAPPFPRRHPRQPSRLLCLLLQESAAQLLTHPPP